MQPIVTEQCGRLVTIESHTKTAEPIEMAFWVCTWVGPKCKYDLVVSDNLQK